MAAGEAGGRDGAAVQADLRSVIERARDARAVLGLGPNAKPAEARAAFHALCKKYHPARFARSSPETVRLANEAFLAIKRAYDGLIAPEPAKETSKPLDVAPSKPAPVATGTVPIAARVTEKIAPQPRPVARPATGAVPAQPRPATGSMPAQPRNATGSMPAQKKDEPAAPPAPSTEVQRFQLALDLLRRRLWRDAEKALGELAVSAPVEKKYRAYRHYAKGRIAQDDGRLDEARAEWERALRLDPELSVARVAIDSLPEPPKPSGGLLSKLFKR